MINFEKKEGVATNNYDTNLVLDCTDTPLHHWLLTVDKFRVKLNVNTVDIEPNILLRYGRLFVGVEQCLFVIDIESGSIINSAFDAFYIQWIEEGAEESVIFAAEDEIIVLDNLGNFLWRKNFPDVIGMTDIIAGNILVTDISGEEYKLKLADGSSVE